MTSSAGTNGFLNGCLRDVYVSVVFLTRLPAPGWTAAARHSLSSAMWAFPVAGALVAIVAGIVFAVFDAVGFPVAVSALMAVAASVIVTGGLHEDGVSDLADGVWGGTSPDGRLAIMSDSRIGAFGALALIVSVAARAAAIAALAEPLLVLGGLIAAGALSRAMMPAVMAFGKPAKPTGLGASAGKPDMPVWAGGLALGAALALVAAPGGWLAALVAAAAGAALVGWFARRNLGGYTGDVLGGVQQVAEIFALALIAGAVTQGG